MSSAHAIEPVADTPTTWEDLRAVVIRHNGVLRIGMAVLREIGGFGRLGTTVRQTLSGKLAGIGVGHLPAELPASQDQQVLLYQYGTPAANVIAAISDTPSEDAETALIRLNTSNELDQLREASQKAVELLSILSDRCRACSKPLL
ncbi:hypothetical protein AB0K60_12470 [Thermopolyspora sp. NPDC052614]|uniref:hypothetical protein n=1 Tax=Thermopolyspora sp. NPDC052614 TaxID=3155682 RepID=UPI0034427E10